MINVIIDEMTPCLKDTISGEIVETEVVQIVRKTFLRKYNKRNGWYVNWAELLSKNEIYALVVKGSVDIQGLVAVRKDDETKCAYISWMCASPNNNHITTDQPRYLGVGGHLFAIAVQKSLDYGYDGFLSGYAANEKLLQHYVESFGAQHLSVLHPYQIILDEVCAKEIKEVYDFEWTDAKI